MSLANGHANGSESGHDIGAAQLVVTSVASAQSAAVMTPIPVLLTMQAVRESQ
jgi:uncharacterized protein YsxB (DUF464 family)